MTGLPQARGQGREHTLTSAVQGGEDRGYTQRQVLQLGGWGGAGHGGEMLECEALGLETLSAKALEAN